MCVQDFLNTESQRHGGRHSQLSPCLRASVVIAFIALLTGCSVAKPGRIETGFITAAKHRLTVGEKKVPNPLPSDAETIARGKSAFSSYCIACHGLDGQNTGVPFAEAMAPPVPSLASKDVQDYTDGQLHAVIRDGVAPSGMPASKGILNDEELWAIVVYLRHLPAKGSLGEPAMYGGGGATK